MKAPPRKKATRPAPRRPPCSKAHAGSSKAPSSDAPDVGPTRVGMRAYARCRAAAGLPGKSLSSVQKALRDGRIWRTCDVHDHCPPDCKSPKSRIDPLVADIAWAEQSARSPEIHGTIAAATLEQKRIANKSALIDLRRKEESTLWRADVEAGAARVGKDVVDTMMALCRRIPNRLAAMDDRRAIQEYVEDEMRRALDRIRHKLGRP